MEERKMTSYIFNILSCWEVFELKYLNFKL